MEHVTQVDMNGCVAACLAMVTGDHYYGSLRFFRKRNFDQHGITMIECMSVLDMLGYKSHFLDGKIDLDKLDKDAILMISGDVVLGSIAQHAVVWDSKAKKIRDPNVGFQTYRHDSKKSYAKRCLAALVMD